MSNRTNARLSHRHSTGAASGGRGVGRETTHSLNSTRIRSIWSTESLLMSTTRLRNTCFPMQLFPTNFFDILIGSQFNSFERKFRKVVPSVSGRSPDLNSLIRRLAYASSSVVHLPRRSGCPPFFLDGAPSPPTTPRSGGRRLVAARSPPGRTMRPPADGGERPLPLRGGSIADGPRTMTAEEDPAGCSRRRWKRQWRWRRRRMTTSSTAGSSTWRRIWARVVAAAASRATG